MHLAGAQPLSLAGGRLVQDKTGQRKTIALFSYYINRPYRIFDQLELSELQNYQYTVSTISADKVDGITATGPAVDPQ